MGKIIYVTEEQFLEGFGKTNESTTVATPQGGDTNMANSINKAKQKVPNADNVMVNPSMFDGNGANDPVQIDVQATNGQDAKGKIDKLMNSNPPLKQLSNKGNLMANVRMESRTVKKSFVEEERKRYMREHAIKIKKGDLDEFLMTTDFI